MMDIIGAYMADPELLKTFFEESCFTDTITQNDNYILTRIYASMAEDGDVMDMSSTSEPADVGADIAGMGMEVMDMSFTGESSALVPDSVIACRPVGLEDENLVRCPSRNLVNQPVLKLEDLQRFYWCKRFLDLCEATTVYYNPAGI